VAVSRDDKHLFVHVNPGREGDCPFRVHKADDLSGLSRRLAADPMGFRSATRVNDVGYG